jgi:hypothetical protein
MLAGHDRRDGTGGDFQNRRRAFSKVRLVRVIT